MECVNKNISFDALKITQTVLVVLGHDKWIKVGKLTTGLHCIASASSSLNCKMLGCENSTFSPSRTANV